MSTGGAATTTGGATSTGGAASSTCDNFSFFVTSQAAMTRESGSSDGFGGDLGGLAGADALCQRIAAVSLACAGQKQWRAFLSTTAENAIDRVGPGPWYDRLGRIVAQNTAALLNDRPLGADPDIINDLPNEDGVPNHAPVGEEVDNHDTLTGSTPEGTLDEGANCDDWTSSDANSGEPRIGHSWPRSAQNAVNWISEHTAPGCEAGVNTGTQNGAGSCVGCSGGYGGIYCFALTP